MIGNAGDRSAQSERGQRIGQGAIHPTDGRERISPRAGCAGLHLDAVEHHGMTSFIVISIENRSKRGKISGWSETNLPQRVHRSTYRGARGAWMQSTSPVVKIGRAHV